MAGSLLPLGSVGAGEACDLLFLRSNPMIPHHLPLGFRRKPAYPPPHICEPTPRTDKADHFLTKSHSRPQEPDVRFEGW